MIRRLINLFACLIFGPLSFPCFLVWAMLVIPALYVFGGISFDALLFDPKYDPFAWFHRWLNRDKS